MNFHSAFDALYVLDALEGELARVYDNELHSFCYLASACNTLEDTTTWGYEFSTARGRLPWSGELAEAVRSLAISGAAVEGITGSQLTTEGRTFLRAQLASSSFKSRSALLDMALSLRAFMTVPEIVHALRSRRNFEFIGEQGLSRSITSELPSVENFEGGRDTLRQYGPTVLLWAWLRDEGDADGRYQS